LGLDVLVDSVLRALAAEPRLLDAAERRDLGRDEPGVDADPPVLESFGPAPHASEVARIEVRREPELRGVGELDRLGIGPEADQRRDRPERFLAEDLRLLRDAGQHGRLEERAAERMALAAREDLRAVRRSVADVVLDL